MWSKITITAVILMLVAGFFAYQNHEATKAEAAKRDEWVRTLERTNANIADEERRIKEENDKVAQLKTVVAELEQRHAELIEGNERVTTEIAQKAADLEEVSKRLADIEQRSAGMKDVAQLAAEIQRTEEDNNRLTQELTVNTAKRDNLIARGEQIDKGIDGLTKLEAEQMARISPAGLRTTVQSTDDSWNFVVVNGGADRGIVLGSKLAVIRGGEKIAELSVNNVEQSKSSADIVPGSKATGVKLMPGDIVESVRPSENS